MDWARLLKPPQTWGGWRGGSVTFVEVVGAVESHLDRRLGVGVLGLQRLYRLPQLSQLGLLR